MGKDGKRFSNKRATPLGPKLRPKHRTGAIVLNDLNRKLNGPRGDFQGAFRQRGGGQRLGEGANGMGGGAHGCTPTTPAHTRAFVFGTTWQVWMGAPAERQEGGRPLTSGLGGGGRHHTSGLGGVMYTRKAPSRCLEAGRGGTLRPRPWGRTPAPPPTPVLISTAGDHALPGESF